MLQLAGFYMKDTRGYRVIHAEPLWGSTPYTLWSSLPFICFIWAINFAVDEEDAKYLELKSWIVLKEEKW